MESWNRRCCCGPLRRRLVKAQFTITVKYRRRTAEVRGRRSERFLRSRKQKIGSELSIDTTNARGRTKHSTFELQHEARKPLERFRPQLTEYSRSVFTKTESPAFLDQRKDSRPPAVKFAPANRS